jgi:hypothetical protein
LEVNDLFAGWDEHPPTNILVKALLEGLGGGNKAKTKAVTSADIPAAAMDAMQKSAMQAIAAKAGPTLPIIQGKDKALPKTPPIFDENELRQRNAEVLKRRATMKVVQDV